MVEVVEVVVQKQVPGLVALTSVVRSPLLHDRAARLLGPRRQQPGDLVRRRTVGAPREAISPGAAVPAEEDTGRAAVTTGRQPPRLWPLSASVRGATAWGASMGTVLGRRAAAFVAAAGLTLGLSPTVSSTIASAAPTGDDARAAAATSNGALAGSGTRTGAARAAVDAVSTPKLDWYRCYGDAQCTTVKVPLDYDEPDGAKVELALLRRKALDSKHRIGSLFVNPGGPGGSATELAYYSDGILSKKVRDRFDIVGMDPRGIAFSDNVTCLTPRTQDEALEGYAEAFPLGADQEKAWIASDRAEGQACSKDTLATSMSTAEVARDMELMRRAVGDKKLSYLGFSYGTYLGQVYANMFPDRFRAITVDGVLDPEAWAGTKSNASQPLEARLDSAAGAWRALHEILVRCDKVGGTRCSFAAGDPVANLRLIADRLRAHPVVITDDEFGDSYTITYQDMVSQMLGDLYDPAGYEDIVDLLSSLYVLTEPPNPAARTANARRTAAAATLAHLHHDAPAGRPVWSPSNDPTSGPRHGFPYDNSIDAFASVTCTDSTETTTSAQFPAFAAQADEKAPYFGRAWLWGTSVCAGDAFTGQDEDAYTGPFTTKTKAPVLYVGDYYDPATNYDAAVSASKRMPNARLLSSDSFGHTAYGTSKCTTNAVDNYLLKATLPRKGKVCTGDIQPFQNDDSGDLRANARRQKAFDKHLEGAFPTQR